MNTRAHPRAVLLYHERIFVFGLLASYYELSSGDLVLLFMSKELKNIPEFITVVITI